MTVSEGLDWSRVTEATYRVEQSLRYEYASPISHLRHRLVIVPRERHGDQRRLSERLTTAPAAALELTRDTFGNEVAQVRLDRVDRNVHFELESVVQRRAAGPHVVAASESAHAAYRTQRRLLRADDAIAAAAADLRALHPDPVDRGQAVAEFVHRSLTYTKAVTDVFTTAAVAFRMRRGVCQDYAHVAIALGRACGLTARYVSGHLIGEGATHAWVEFVIPRPDGTALVESYDPTHGVRTSLRYVTVAVGRDYEDVAPTSGVFVGASGGTLQGRQRLVLLAVDAA